MRKRHIMPTLVLSIWVALGSFNLGQRWQPEPIPAVQTITSDQYRLLTNELEEANERADSWRGRFELLDDAPEKPPLVVEVPVLVSDTIYEFVYIRSDILTVGELAKIDSIPGDSVRSARVRTVDVAKCDDWSIYAGRIVCDRKALGDWALYAIGGLGYNEKASLLREAGVSWKPYRNSPWEARVGINQSGLSATVTRYIGR